MPVVFDFIVDDPGDYSAGIQPFFDRVTVIFRNDDVREFGGIQEDIAQVLRDILDAPVIPEEIWRQEQER